MRWVGVVCYFHRRACLPGGQTTNRIFNYRRDIPGAGEVAEFFVLPVEEALEDFHGQRFAGGEDGAQRGPHVFAELFQVGELA